MKKYLFLGLSHEIGDSRLFWRQIKLISHQKLNLRFYYLNRKIVEDLPFFHKFSFERYTFDGVSVIIINSFVKKYRFKRVITRKTQNLFVFIKEILLIKKIRPNIIQASDYSELVNGLVSSFFTGSKKIYDSHEDYIRQAYDFGKKNILLIIKIPRIYFIELFFPRFFDHVFCTDEYLLNKYKKKRYGIKDLALLRNYPLDFILKKAFNNNSNLKLVYIGGTIKYKGVFEVINYVKTFNKQNHNFSLELDIYSSSSNIHQSDLGEKIRLFSSIDYDKLVRTLNTKYDIGVCLWHPIKKLSRNLPLKNFDYMAAGLPILTSDFGNLKKEMIKSNSGYMINPFSYEEFEKSIIKLYDVERRKTLSSNGIKYVSSNANFTVEANAYISFIGSVLNE